MRAGKRRSLNEERLKKTRRRMNMLFAVLLALTAAAAAVPASKLIASYRNWRQLTWTQSVDIPLEHLPATVSVTVYYDTEPPVSPILVDPFTKRDLDASLTDNGGSLTLSVDLPQDYGDAIRLTLHPETNRKLDYGVSIGPSKAYIGCRVSLAEDADGHIWLKGDASCPFALEHGQPVHATLILTGKLREPILWDEDLGSDGKITLDVTDAISEKGYNLLPGEHLRLLLSAMPDPEGIPTMSFEEELYLDAAVPETTTDS